MITKYWLIYIIWFFKLYLLPFSRVCNAASNWKLVAFKKKRGFFVWNFSLPPLNYHYPWFFFSSNLIFFCTSTPAIIHSEDGNLYSPFFSAPARSPALFVVCFYFFVCFYFSLSLSISKYLLWKKYSCQICFSLLRPP